MITRENVKELLPIFKAYAEGKTIEVKNFKGEWLECDEPYFDSSPSNYRIKEIKYRPFKSQKECWEEMLKHQPFGWVNDECKYVHIVCVYKNQIEFSPDQDDDDILHSCIMTFSDVLEQGYTFADGTPFGIKEE